ncbi:putative ABC multidrug transporter [Aureobasidium pullulans]|nr:putative ABC multidrug transporter [Aureobasidium pullulans]THZ08457.1 putative ABC multidrug transporter [Aureobasidium pullulans]
MEYRTTQQIADDAVGAQPYQFQSYEQNYESQETYAAQQNYAAPELSRKSSDDIEEVDESSTPRSRGSSDGTIAYAPINIPGEDQEAMRNDLMTLTRSGTTSSAAGLDPSAKDFSLEKWLRAFIKDFDAEDLKATRAGIVWKNLSVSGSGAALQLQDTVAGIALKPLATVKNLFSRTTERKQILHNFNGNLKSGELLIVLGRPGSGCSTFLKALCGETHGLHIDDGSEIHYNGVSQKQMMKEFKGEVVYNQELPILLEKIHADCVIHRTVGQTLEFAASTRTPSHRIRGMSRQEFSTHTAKVIMSVFGLSHTYNTKVGSDFVRGVSGGERKRVSIAEMALTGSPLAAWDNSTRGLDSATAFKFVNSLRTLSALGGSAHAVAIYQASQQIYDLFDKAIVLYEGRTIYYGSASKARAFFEKQGWNCDQRQTTGDFLTGLTNPAERKARKGMENKVPRTPEDFEKYWLESSAYKAMEKGIDEHEKSVSGEKMVEAFRENKGEFQANHTRLKSPYMISVPMQIKLNTKRSYQRIWNDLPSTTSAIAVNVFMALIIGSIFYGTPDATVGFMSKGAVLFFAVLLNALTAMNEINSLYAQRPIVEKHKSYALYHPATEAIAGVVADIPVKFVTTTVFNLILYFLAGLRREPSQFFIYFLITFVVGQIMSAVFRTLAAVTKTISQAMTLAGIMVLALVIYTGYVLPQPYMKPWFAWIHYINPIYYAFEILVANEFHGREFTCSQFIPAYPNLQGDSFICSQTGAVAGRRTVNGDNYIQVAYEYSYSHVWRNFGIMIAFLIGFMAMYFIAVEINSSTSSTAEVLVFRKGHAPANLTGQVKEGAHDEEAGAQGAGSAGHTENDNVDAIPAQQDIFTWRDVVYDIKIKGEPRRLLDHVSGYVKPGTLTALMGVSGAGKTTLLDSLAQRTTMGVITGDMLVNGKPIDASFQRGCGYVQQQDLHLETATVRESLRFSAMLRQPKSVSKQEKYDYVEEVIKMLDMEDFAEAVVGVPGEGLNVEQRKLLTIGVELAAKPKLLLFLDEPTSGLDSQSAWAICAFLRKLADAGQAVLCTIHQPSAVLFQEFDRLLFLAKGGKTVYFGDIGENSRTLLDYFENNGARHCDDEENPAEFMLEIVNAGSSGQGPDWHEVWKNSEEAKGVQTQIDELHEKSSHRAREHEPTKEELSEFAMPLTAQITVVTQRVFQQYWRMPSYILAKWMLGTCAGLFIGFSFYQADSSTQGLQNVIFSAFMVCTIFSSLVQQIMPLFVNQRSLYEVRERPSKAYSWKAFILANIVVEIPYNVILAVLVFGSYYYAVQGIQTSLQQGLVLLFLIEFFIYAGTFAHLCIVAMPDAQTAAAIVTLLFAMSLVFNGVMQAPDALPGFWIFMYRVSPFTYWIGGIVASQLHGKPIVCNSAETSVFNPPAGQTCGQYMAAYLTAAPGTLQNPTATADCQYCSLSNADQFLSGSNIYYSQVWRNFGIFWAYIVFNICAAVFLYWAFRVTKWDAAGVKEKLKGLHWPRHEPLAKNKEGEKQRNVAHPY